jgi:RNA polymerase sigma-70 factor (ECF subfamily)
MMTAQPDARPRARARSDAELAAATASDPEAFGELYRRHETSVLQFFLHWTQSAELAADLTAETFASALRSLPTFDASRGELRGWLFGISRHVLARSLERGRVEDAARRRLGMPRLLVDDEALERIDALGGVGSAGAGLAALSDPLREAVTGRIVEEREYRELARALNTSESVVRQRVRRGLARLRAQMEDQR